MISPTRTDDIIHNRDYSTETLNNINELLAFVQSNEHKLRTIRK